MPACSDDPGQTAAGTWALFASGAVLGAATIAFSWARSRPVPPRAPLDPPAWGIVIAPNTLRMLGQSLLLYSAYSLLFALIFLPDAHGDRATLSRAFVPSEPGKTWPLFVFAYFSAYLLALNAGLQQRLDAEVYRRFRGEVCNGHVLSLRVGRGFTPCLCARHLTGGHVTAVDPFRTIVNRDSQAWAAENVDRLGLGERVSVLECDARVLQCEEGTFDAVVWDSTVSHAYTDDGDTSTLLIEASRALRHKGVLLLFDEAISNSELRDAGFVVVRRERQFVPPSRLQLQRTVRLCRIEYQPRWTRTVRELPPDKAAVPELIDTPPVFYAPLLGVRVVTSALITAMAVALAHAWPQLSLPDAASLPLNRLNDGFLVPAMVWFVVGTLQVHLALHMEVREQRLLGVAELWKEYFQRMGAVLAGSLLLTGVTWVPYLVIELSSDDCAQEQYYETYATVGLVALGMVAAMKSRRPTPPPRHPCAPPPSESGAASSVDYDSDRGPEEYALLG